MPTQKPSCYPFTERTEECAAMSLPTGGAWLSRRPPRPDARIQLYCLPHAGAGASAYREWLRRIDPRVDVIALQLPGRERRIAEPPPSGIDWLADQVTDVIADAAGGLPFAVFGHSMGGLVAYEVAQRTTRRGLPPEHVIVSGYPAPHLPRDHEVHQLPDSELVEHITALQGTPHEVLANSVLLRETLPILRADFANCETYRYPGDPPLRAPLTVLGGRADPTAPVPALRRWQDLSAGRFALHLFDGGHFFLHDHLSDVLDVVTSALSVKEATDDR